MIPRTYSASLQGMDGEIIQIEAAKQSLIPKIVITGLPGNIVKESRERIRVCLNHLGFHTPSTQMVVHLSPASAKKQGSQLDLGIAMSLLRAEGYIPSEHLSRCGFLGELSLEGRIKPIPGILSLAEILSRQDHIEFVFIPQENADECRLLSTEKIIPVKHLGECLEFLDHKITIEPLKPRPLSPLTLVTSEMSFPTLDNVIGQTMAKQALKMPYLETTI